VNLARIRGGLLVAGLALVDCRDPTQVTLLVTTDEPCARVTRTQIAVGTPGVAESAAPVSVTSDCHDGTIGTLVVAPAHGGDEKLGVVVATTLDGDGGACAAPPWGPNCIVERRLVAFAPHTPLSLPIAMNADCAGVTCDASTTCFRGACYPIAGFDPAACDAGHCSAVDGGTDAAMPPDASTDAGTDASAEAGAPGTCAADADCTPPSACYTGTCDLSTRTCAYALCVDPTRSCSAGICGSGGKCSPPMPYGFHTSSFIVPGAIGCNGVAGTCFAAVYPFVFVGTNAGVRAYPRVDLTDAAPSSVDVGATTVPRWLVASGRRVFVVGAPRVLGASASFDVATIDVPADPTATAMHAAMATYSGPVNPTNAFAATDGALFLVDDTGKAALLRPPLTGGATSVGTGPPGTTVFYASPGFPPGQRFVAASGDRLLSYAPQSGGGWNDAIALHASAGTSHAQSAGTGTVVWPGGWLEAGVSTAMGDDGSVALFHTLAPGNCQGISVAFVNVPIADSLTPSVPTSIDGSNGYGFANHCDTSFTAGAIAWLAPKQWLVVSASDPRAPGTPSTGVALLDETGSTPSVPADRTYELANVTATAAFTSAAAARGLGHVLVFGPSNQLAVHTFDPRCAAR
jgi:hypothetical protein